jgi:hypothetical protein
LTQEEKNNEVKANEFTTFETLREEFVRPEEQISIFEDNVEDILEMNAAIAMLTKNNVPDPLDAQDELCREEKMDQDQDDLALNTDAVLAKLNDKQTHDILYDSDGNPLEMYQSDEGESVDLQVQKQPGKHFYLNIK